ncbi:hypothetical protein CN632_19755 [Bacillus pseudomycoides]|nr:hypothetical protein CON86_28725 [Bacillus pseudomycoides]PEM73762.1 hypothetical protein CN632_19755 [Bacillus pseudomycoides]
MWVGPHAHQAKILRNPHNENFTFLQLFMRIRLIFSILGNNQFLKLMAMYGDPMPINLRTKAE